eukprot:2872785-Lingulodinium_polyedra.AAC.1
MSWARQRERFNRADMMFRQALFQVVAKSNETIRFDISAKRLEFRKERPIMMKGRRMLWVGL